MPMYVRGSGLFVGLVALLLAVLPTIVSAANALDSVLVVPNPYNVSGRTFGQKSYIWGYERIRFAHLPLPCTIRIYSSDANLVTVLRFDQGTTLPAWDGRNADNQYVVSDLYYYVIEHSQLGTRIGKFAVIR